MGVDVGEVSLASPSVEPLATSSTGPHRWVAWLVGTLLGGGVLVTTVCLTRAAYLRDARIDGILGTYYLGVMSFLVGGALLVVALVGTVAVPARWRPAPLLFGSGVVTALVFVRWLMVQDHYPCLHGCGQW